MACHTPQMVALPVTKDHQSSVLNSNPRPFGIPGSQPESHTYKILWAVTFFYAFLISGGHTVVMRPREAGHNLCPCWDSSEGFLHRVGLQDALRGRLQWSNMLFLSRHVRGTHHQCDWGLGWWTWLQAEECLSGMSDIKASLLLPFRTVSSEGSHCVQSWLKERLAAFLLHENGASVRISHSWFCLRDLSFYPIIYISINSQIFYNFYNIIQCNIIQYYFITQVVLALETHAYIYTLIHTCIRTYSTEEWSQQMKLCIVFLSGYHLCHLLTE